MHSSLAERYEAETTVDEIPFFCVYTHRHGERLLTVEIVDQSPSNRRLKKACEAMSQSPQVCSAKTDDGKIICTLHTFIYRGEYSQGRLKSYELVFEPILRPIAEVLNAGGNALCRALSPDTSQHRYLAPHAQHQTRNYTFMT